MPLCKCGCSQEVQLGIKGKPNQFVHGHNRKGKIGWWSGKHPTLGTRLKQSQSNKLKPWNKDILQLNSPGYDLVHKRLRRAKVKIGTCSKCGEQPGIDARNGTQNALIRGRETHIDSRNRVYSMKLIDYVELCRSCHRRYDLEGREKIE